MKNKILTTMALWLAFLPMATAKLELKEGSLKARPNDTEILINRRTPEQRQLITDDNGQLCALLKITFENVSDEDQNAFRDPNNRETDRATFITKIETEHVNEVWVFLSPGANYMILKHPNYGNCKFAFGDMGFHLEKGKVYEAVVEGQSLTVSPQQESVGGQYLLMAVEPKDALVSIDGIPASVVDGTVSKFYSYGRHSYSVEAPYYKTQQGFFEISSARRTDLTLRLQPQYGMLRIQTRPEQGATVYVDGVEIGTTPCFSGRLSEGEHELMVNQNMYHRQTKKVMVRMGDTLLVDLEMLPTFAQIALSCQDAQADLYINNQYKAKGSWTGRLEEGFYQIEARKDHHRSVQKTQQVQARQNQEWVLSAPLPIYGSLNINTTPANATIMLDGKRFGTTPNVFGEIIIGSHEIVLQKEGYQDQSFEVRVEEGKVASLMAELKPQLQEASKSTTVRDADGNTYKTVTIGTQTWMAENLKTTKYNDGSSIPNVTNNDSWADLSTGAYCWYDNDASNRSTYGALYNWYAVNTGKLCPKGWHVPTDEEWTALTEYVGGRSTAGDKLKEAGSAHWKYYFKYTPKAANAYGFTALPGGYRHSGNGSFNGIGNYGYWWSSTEYYAGYVCRRSMSYSGSNVGSYDNSKEYGFSVRCLRN